MLPSMAGTVRQTSEERREQALVAAREAIPFIIADQPGTYNVTGIDLR
jgi:hypothetical protein